MFKIQNFLLHHRFLFNKIFEQMKRSWSTYQLLSLSHTKLCIPLPTPLMVGVTAGSINQFKLELHATAETKITTASKEDVKLLMTNIATQIREEKLNDAIVCINEAIQVTERNDFIEFLPQLYDFLVIINLREGKNDMAEVILVRSIEKLTEIGYAEADNAIIRFQLILARLYQMKGDAEMAGLGFRNCLSVQEAKFNRNKDMDGDTSSLYLNTLFWYGVFLSDLNDLVNSKYYMEKALRISKITSNDPARNVIILHNLAELSFRLKNFDDVIEYLIDGLRLCLQNISLDSALPVFMVKLGLVYLIKGMHEAANYWCSIAQIFGKSTNNACVENEASLCLQYLKEEQLKRKQ